jgi:hypothetical protein
MGLVVGLAYPASSKEASSPSCHRVNFLKVMIGWLKNDVDDVFSRGRIDRE